MADIWKLAGRVERDGILIIYNLRHPVGWAGYSPTPFYHGRIAVLTTLFGQIHNVFVDS